jgi:hypothetical protein
VLTSVWLLAISACVHTWAAAPKEPRIRLPVRVQLLYAPDGQAVSTIYGDSAVHQLLAVANHVWAQARITWVLESIVRTRAPRGAAFDSLLRGEIFRAREPL